MLKSLAISLLFLFQIPFPGPGRAPVGGGGGNTFTFVKSAQTSGLSSGGTMEGPSGTGNVAVLMFQNNSGTDFTSVSISGGGTWTTPSACHSGSGSVGYIACAYTLSTTAAATITVTYSGGSIATSTIWEYTPSGTPSLDGEGSCSSTSANPVNGCTPTLSGSNDVIVQGIAIASAQASSVATYGNIVINSPNYAAAADLRNSASTTPPVWTLTGSSAIYGSWVAIK